MLKLNNILEDIKTGIPVILVDDYDRENEADLVISAKSATYHNILFMINHAKGLMCVPCMESTLNRLNIPMMPRNNKDHYGTPFTISVDAVKDVTTGMSVNDRLNTISTISSPTSGPDDLAQPGHLFPLRAHTNLLKGRRGHTEGSIELMRLAKVPEISVIVEIMNPDGTMAKGIQIVDYSRMYNLRIISISDIYNEMYNK